MTITRIFSKKKYYLYDSQLRIDHLKSDEERLKRSGYDTVITAGHVGWNLWVYSPELEKILSKTKSKKSGRK
jgi:hypothetical protein